MKKKLNKSKLLKMIGDTPQLRVWDFLIENHFFDFNLTEIIKGANISYNSLIKFFPDWIKKGFIIEIPKNPAQILQYKKLSLPLSRKSYNYKLNLKNPIVKYLIKLDWSIIKNDNK